MTAPEYRAAIELIGLNQTEAGKFFGVNGVTGRRWAANGPPPPVVKMLRLMIALRFTPAYVENVLGDSK